MARCVAMNERRSKSNVFKDWFNEFFSCLIHICLPKSTVWRWLWVNTYSNAFSKSAGPGYSVQSWTIQFVSGELEIMADRQCCHAERWCSLYLVIYQTSNINFTCRWSAQSLCQWSVKCSHESGGCKWSVYRVTKQTPSIVALYTWHFQNVSSRKTVCIPTQTATTPTITAVKTWHVYTNCNNISEVLILWHVCCWYHEPFLVSLVKNQFRDHAK
jgi:hypothetical protein